MTWGTPQEIETRRRIHVAVAAYAYEFESDPILSDAEFDKLCYEVDLNIDTTNPSMDKWFRENFDPSTGMWIHHHPDIEGLKRVLQIMRLTR